jgi:hypothetical protein
MLQEYLYQLAASMRQIAGHVEDDHLFSLEQSVRLLDGETHQATVLKPLGKKKDISQREVNSTDGEASISS